MSSRSSMTERRKAADESGSWQKTYTMSFTIRGCLPPVECMVESVIDTLGTAQQVRQMHAPLSMLSL